MNAAQENALRYFRTALELDNLTAVEYSQESGGYWRLSADVAQSLQDGKLDTALAKEIFAAYFKENKIPREKRSDQNSVNIIVSLRTATNADITEGLLNIAGTLSKTGELSAADVPWIPLNNLTSEQDGQDACNEIDSTDGADNEGKQADNPPVIVGNLNDYWDFWRENIESLQSHTNAWRDYQYYAENLFACVTENMPSAESAAIDTDVFIKLGDHANANETTIDLYKELLRVPELAPLLQKIMEPNSEHHEPDNSDIHADKPEDMLVIQGTMSKRYSLKNSQRSVVQTCAKSQDGDVVAFNIPQNATQTMVLWSVVADLVVKHALARQHAPLIVGSSMSARAVVDLAQSFSSVVPEKHGVLDSRWLPLAAKKSRSRKEPEVPPTLNGIVAFCADDDPASAAKSFELVENSKKSGAYAQYSEKSYLDKASVAVLDFAERLFKERPDDIADAQNRLYEWLTCLNESCENLVQTAVQAQAESSRIEHPGEEQNAQDAQNAQDMPFYDRLDERISKETSRLLWAQARLSSWMSVNETRQTKGVFRKKPNEEDAELIAANIHPEDDFDKSLKTLDDIVDYYKKIVDEQNDTIAKLRGTKDNCEQRDQQYFDAVSATKALIAKIGDSGRMSRRFDSFAKKFNPYDKGFLTALDKFLDASVRYVEFWLAMHYFECQWIIDCSTPGKFIHENVRLQRNEEIQQSYWEQITSLCPVIALSQSQLPEYFVVYKKGRREPDQERIDLLIVTEAEQINTPCMLASFALAKRTLVIGDTTYATPAWALTPEIDKQIALDCGITDNWEKRQESGLTASKPSSIMRAALHSCS